MEKKYPKFDEERAENLLTSLRGEGEEKPRKMPSTSLDVAGNVVDVLETLPDVTHKQRRIAYLLSRNKLPVEVASVAGCTTAYVRAIMPDPRIVELVKIFRGGRIYEFAEDISAREVLKRAAARAAEVLAEKMNNAIDEGTQLRAAVEILKSTGDIGGNDRIITEITIEQDTVKIFQKAIEEVEEDIQEADYELAPSIDSDDS